MEERYALTPLKLAIHRESQSPLDLSLSASTTFVEVADEGGGPFLLIHQDSGLSVQEIRLDFSEIPLLVKAAEILENELQKESDQ